MAFSANLGENLCALCGEKAHPASIRCELNSDNYQVIFTRTQQLAAMLLIAALLALGFYRWLHLPQ